jgi:four helix bundle protein
MRDYKKILAWQLADQLVSEIYGLSKLFPKEEVYGLTSQIRRAAVSVPTNIAEGASRKHKRDYLHFLYISRGSLSETEYLLSLGKRFGYVDNEPFTVAQNLVQEAHSTLYGLINAVESELPKT